MATISDMPVGSLLFFDVCALDSTLDPKTALTVLASRAHRERNYGESRKDFLEEIIATFYGTDWRSRFSGERSVELMRRDADRRLAEYEQSVHEEMRDTGMSEEDAEEEVRTHGI